MRAGLARDTQGRRDMATRSENIASLNEFSRRFRIDDPADRLEVRLGSGIRYLVVAMGYDLAVPARTAREAAALIRSHYRALARGDR